MELFEFKMNLFNLICITLLAVMAAVTVAAILFKFRMFTFCVCPRFSDDVYLGRLLLYFLQICNFWSDIYLLYALYWISDIYIFTPINVVLSSSLLFLIISTVLINIVFLDKWLFPWIVSNTNSCASHWIRDRELNRWFIALIAISGSAYHSMLMANCKLFGVTRTNMAISTWNLMRILRNNHVVRLFYSYSLTVLLIQGATFFLAEAVYYANMVSITLTVLSMIIFIVHDHCCYPKRYDHGVERVDISYFHLVVEMADYHNDDEYKVNESKEMRRRWTECIQRELQRNGDQKRGGMACDHGMGLEVVAVEEMRNPNLQMFTVYCVVSDVDSYWMQRMGLCTTLDVAIKEEFDLAEIPKLNFVH